MDPDHNPYTPGAGSIPPETAGRSQEFEDFGLLVRRLKLGNHERSIIVYGPRGVGKTVFLNECEPIAIEAGFHARYRELTQESSLLDITLKTTRNLILKLSLSRSAKKRLAAALGYLWSIRVVLADDVEFTLTKRPDEDELSDDLSELFTEVGQLAIDKGTGMILLLDELQFADKLELRALLSALHRVSQKNLPIAIAAAGLPQLPGVVAEARTYAERLFKFRPIGRLSDEASREALSEPASRRGVHYTEDALQAAVEWSHGYPFYLQQIGSDTWDIAQGPGQITEGDVIAARPIALRNLDDGFFKSRVQRVTRAEEGFMAAMASLGPGPYRIGEVAKAMGRSSTSAISPLREGLIQKGLINPTEKRGYIDFSVPLFHEYLNRKLA